MEKAMEKLLDYIEKLKNKSFNGNSKKIKNECLEILSSVEKFIKEHQNKDNEWQIPANKGTLVIAVKKYRKIYPNCSLAEAVHVVKTYMKIT